MTQTTGTNTTTQSKPVSLSREELHKTFAGVLYESDFSTSRPSPWNLDRISQTISHSGQYR